MLDNERPVLDPPQPLTRSQGRQQRLLRAALVLALVSLWPLRGTSAHRVFVTTLVLGLVTEICEQTIFPDQVPKWADIAPPLLFTISGVALMLTARDATRTLDKASPTVHSL